MSVAIDKVIEGFNEPYCIVFYFVMCQPAFQFIRSEKWLYQNSWDIRCGAYIAVSPVTGR